MGVVSGIVKESGTPVGGRIVRAYRRDTGAMLGEAVSSDGAVIPGNPNFANVVLQLHMEGETSTVDSSGTPKTVTINSGAVLTSAGAKYGAKGLQPSSAGLTAASHSDFALPGDFTFECWFYVISWSPGLASLFNIGAYNSGALFRVRSNLIELFINGAVTSVSATISSGAWHHIAWSRVSGSVGVYLDGALAGTVSNGGSIPAGNVRVGVSAHNGGEYINGYIDEARLHKGVGIYTAPFTPPSRAFPDTATDLTTALGSYSISTSHVGEVQVVCLDDSAGTTYNDLIARTTPE